MSDEAKPKGIEDLPGRLRALAREVEQHNYHSWAWELRGLACEVEEVQRIAATSGDPSEAPS